jgi:hypothetical protein
LAWKKPGKKLSNTVNKNIFMQNKAIYFLIIIIIAGFRGQAQESAYVDESARFDGWEVGLMVGWSQYYGEVNQDGLFSKFNGQSPVSWSFTAGKRLSDYITVGGQLMGGRLIGENNSVNNNSLSQLRMESGFFEIGGNMTYDLNHLWLEYGVEKRWRLYGLTGLGFGFYSNIVLTDLITNSEFNSNADKSKFGLVFPLGVGFEYQIKDSWFAFTELTWRTVLTDQMDRIDGKYIPDSYLHWGIGVKYRFGMGNEQPDEHPTSTEATPVQNRYEAITEGPQVLDFEISENTCKESVVQLQGDTVTDMNPQNQSTGHQGVRPQNTLPTEEMTAFDRSELPGGLVFTVQIIATSKPININDWKSRYGVNMHAREYVRDGLYRYLVGTYRSYQEALRQRNQIRNQGIHDAFIRAFRDGHHVNITPQMKNN